MLEQPAILTRDGHAQVDPQAQARQPGLGQEIGIFGFDDQIVGLDIGGERHLSLDLDYVSLDNVKTLLPGDGGGRRRTCSNSSNMRSRFRLAVAAR